MEKKIYSVLFVDSIKKGIGNAKLNTNQFADCTTKNKSVSLFDKKTFLKFIISKYLLGLIGSKIYQIIQESNNVELKRFLNFFVYISYNWEVNVASFNKKLLVECPQFEPKKWKDGEIRGKPPLFKFSAITSMYGDISIALISYLLLFLENDTNDIFRFGQEQEANVQKISENVGNRFYRDSDNFNPREFFLDINYPLSLIPQMIWHAFTIDIIQYSKTNDDSLYLELERLGSSYMKPENVKEYQKRMRLIIALAIRELDNKPFQIEIKEIETLLNRINFSKITPNKNILAGIISIVKEFLPFTKKNNISNKNRLESGIILMENVIENVGNNFIKDSPKQLFNEIRRFY